MIVFVRYDWFEQKVSRPQNCSEQRGGEGGTKERREKGRKERRKKRVPLTFFIGFTDLSDSG